MSSLSIFRPALVVFFAFLALISSPAPAQAVDNHVVVWGAQSYDSRNFDSPIKKVAAGLGFTLALKADGTVAAWGDSANYAVHQLLPPVFLRDVAEIAAGNTFGMALFEDGTVRQWGALSALPFTVESATVKAIAAGTSYALALTIDGTVLSWGSNSHGQTTVPAEAIGVKAIAAGARHAVALKEDGTVVAWGANNHGQATVPADLADVAAIAAGDSHTVALKSDGTIVAWGFNGLGQTNIQPGLTGVIAIAAGAWTTVALKEDGTVLVWGGASETERAVPAGLSEVVAISSAFSHTVALKSDGTLFSWGEGTFGETLAPRLPTGIKAIAAGGGHTLGLRHDGTVTAWGNNYYGQANVPANLTDVVAIDAGGAFSVALRENGTVLCWGEDLAFQTRVPPGLGSVKAIAAGASHVLALKEDGTVVGWGRDSFGSTTAPADLSSVKAIAAGGSHSVALKTDGTVVAWGSDARGQATVPPGLSEVVAIAAGDQHTVALKADGTVVAWGFNNIGQATVPDGLADVVQIDAALFNTAALKADGTVVTWGAGGFGQAPLPSNLKAVSAIAAGMDHIVALIPDETERPELHSPLSGGGSSSPLFVAYFLPENAAPSSVKLLFTGETTVVLTLNASGEVAGWHEFELDLRNPATGPFAGTTALIPDGTYTVTLSYQDRLLNPPATSLPAAGVKFDTTGPIVETPAGGFTSLAVREGTPLPDYTAQMNAEDISGTGPFTQLPAPGTVLPVGWHEVTITGQDAFGNETTGTIRARVAPSEPLRSVILETGTAVPGAGEAGSDVPEEAVWDSFGDPAINDAGDIALTASYRVDRAKYRVVILKSESTGVNFLAQAGGAVPGAGSVWNLPENATYALLNDPLLASDGSAVFIATIKGTGVTGRNNKVVIHYSPDPAHPGLGATRVIARTGTPIPTADGATLKTIAAIALESGDAAVLRGTLAVGSGNPKARPTTDAVALRLDIDGDSPTVLLREGYSPGGTVPVLRSFQTLIGADRAMGHGRGWLARPPAHFGDSGQGTAVFSALGTDSGGERHLVEVALSDAMLPSSRQITWAGASDFDNLEDASVANVWVPSRSASGFFAMRFLLRFPLFPHNESNREHIALVDAQNHSALLAAGHDLVLGNRYSMRDPVQSMDGTTLAFAAKVSQGSRNSAGVDGFFWRSLAEGQPLRRLATANTLDLKIRETWKKLTSLAAPGGTIGPIFTATLNHRRAGLPGGSDPLFATSAANDAGLWAIDSTETLCTLLREGDLLEGKTVKTLHVLNAAMGVQGTGRNYNGSAEVVLLVTATDKSTRVVKILVP